MTPDTSTQAMEAIAEYLEVLRQPYWADKVRIVAAERDNARRTALEDAAKVADRRAFYAFAKCERLGPTDPTTGMAECLHEANGEDCLCQQVHEDAENMAHAIRALIETTNEEK